MDIETAVCDWLADLGATFTVTPLNLGDIVPAIRVARVAGDRDDREDHPTLDVQVYTTKSAADPRSSLDLAETICDRFLAYPFVAGGVVVDFAHCSTAPVSIGAYPDTTLSVTRAIYTLTIRR